MGLENWFRAWSFWLFAPQCFEDKIFVNTFIQNAFQYPYIQSILGFKGQIEAISTFDTRDRLEKIGAKTLVITGNEDILIPQKESEILRKGISKSSMSRIENTAHNIHLEKPRYLSRRYWNSSNYRNKFSNPMLQPAATTPRSWRLSSSSYK